jgi:hypothetical protein
MPSNQSGGTLRRELERAIRNGRCVYCRRAASPDQPLTQEHVIPRARGGTRKDVSIIVPACARCNQRRGCSELVRFLLVRPSRISAFLDYLSTLSPDGLRQMDDRVLAEVYAAVWMLRESWSEGEAWRERLKRLCSGRTLHRRRYAARRVVGALGGRLDGLREREDLSTWERAGTAAECGEEESALEPAVQIDARLVTLFALGWRVSEETVRGELSRQHERALRGEAWRGAGGDDVAELDGRRSRPRKRRMRVDRRRGRGAGVRRTASPASASR